MPPTSSFPDETDGLTFINGRPEGNSGVPAGRMGGGKWLADLTARMRAIPLWLSLAPPLALMLVIGWMDHVTGWEVSWFIFYAMPIILAVWWSGFSGGMVLAIVSGPVWWLANRNNNPYVTEVGYAWAMLNREFYFCVLVFALNVFRSKQDADAAHIQMLEERRQMEMDIIKVSEHEQQRIGQDLHDGLCQQLAAIGCAVHALAEELNAQGLPAARDATLVMESVQQAVADARDLARGIFPVHVDKSGFSVALKELADNTSRLTGVSIVIRESGEIQISCPKVAMHLYRIAQEAVANAVRHGGAREIDIAVDRRGDMLEMRLEDNGAGISADKLTTSPGMGLRTMRYRAQSVGGTLEVVRRSSGGTCVCCRLRMQAQEAGSEESI